MGKLLEDTCSFWMLEADEEVGSVGWVEEEALWPSTCPRSRVGSMMFLTRFLSSFVSGEDQRVV